MDARGDIFNDVIVRGNRHFLVVAPGQIHVCHRVYDYGIESGQLPDFRNQVPGTVNDLIRGVDIILIRTGSEYH
jgi:hypothetical protein